MAGQAMTEFVITASYVLVPLFIMVPMLGKYIDIKHAAIQTARYEAWEYTVWYNSDDDNEILDNFDAATVPEKTTADTRDEARVRVMSDPTARGVLDIDAADRDIDIADVINPLWTDHRALPLWDGTYDAASSAALVSSDDTPTIPVLGDVFTILMDVVDFAFSALGDVLGFLGSPAKFSAINNDGYAHSDIAMPIKQYRNQANVGTILTARDDTRQDIIFSASAGVLSDAWNAGGVEHTSWQAKGTVPTVLLQALLELPVLSTIWDVVTVLAPELSRCHPGFPLGEGDFMEYNDGKGSLWFSHIDIDAVHPDRLSTGGVHECNDRGQCYFVPGKTMAQMDCVSS